MLITMNVNGKKVDIDVSYDEYLVDTLRRIGNLSVKRGCDTGCCGLCSIWIDEKPTLSCSTLSVRANKKNITTIEGLPTIFILLYPHVCFNCSKLSHITCTSA